MADEVTVAKLEASKKGGRGVSYPVMGLEEALEKARAFHREERKSAAPVASAIKHFGYSETSSGGRQVVATLIQFGLLEDEGRSENRQVKLTDRALTILLDEPQSPDRLQALKECATMPKLYSLILAKYPGDLPSDHTLGFYLQKDFDFNPKTLKAFIQDFRGTLSYANVVGGPKMPSPEMQKPDSGVALPDIPKRDQVDIGDLIQWEASGVLRLDAPRRVRAKDQYEGAWWVFVEGSETGIPMSEAVLIEKKAADVVPGKAPPTMPMPGLPPASTQVAGAGEREWLRGPLSRDVNYRLVISGDMGPKEIGKLIKLLEAQKAVLDDEDEPLHRT